MSRQESGENLKEKIRNLFKFSSKTPPLAIPKTQTKEIIFTPDVLREIGPESPANNRMKRIKELSECVRSKKLEENAVEALWKTIADLVQPHVPTENRQIALYFLQCLLDGQLHELGILRGHFFNVIQDVSLPGDLPYRLELFKILSENGRNLYDFEDETGPFLLKWMPDVMSAGHISEFLSLLVNIIKYNAAYLDEDVVSGLVMQTCMIPNGSRSDQDGNLKLCLEVLDSVVCYSYLPSSSLYHFIAALCHMVNKPRFCEDSWELMRKLLGTHLGHSSIYTMCCILQDRRQPADYFLLRGAVFFIGMALWGSRRVQSLRHTPASVLPSFLQALSSCNQIVAYEVVLSIQRLVKKYGKDIKHVTWDVLLDITEALLKQQEVQSTVDTPIDEEIHDVLTAIENLHQHGHFIGSVPRFFKIIEFCASKRSEDSVKMLIDYHARSIHPGKDNWTHGLFLLLEKYFRQERRTEIRRKSLDVLSFVIGINKHIYEADLIEKVVIPHLGHIESDPDPVVRQVAAELLLLLAQGCNSIEFMDIIGLVEKIIRKPLVGEIVPPPTSDGIEVRHKTDERNIIDIKTAVLKLVEVFRHKLYVIPSSHCLKIYEMMISHLKTHYSQMYMGSSACCIRKAMTELFLQLRSDSFYRLGLIYRGPDTQCAYSPYIVCKQCEEKEVFIPSSPGGPGSTTGPWFQPPAVIDYTEAFKLYIVCLECELNWDVLRCLLENLPLVLQNKTLILSARDKMVDTLCHSLCSMVNDRSLGFPEKLQNLPSKFTRSDFHTYIFPVLAAMVTFHDYLDRNRQRELIKCLEFGLVSKCAKVCVSALRISALEMQDVMMRLLPSVLLSLSKISATMSMAIPVLAFLSSVVRLPNLYANFVEDQYMSVFAIALPYTNPFKFSHYTVSLAHHVIAIWFIRCRLPFRKAFVKFIHKGLKANVLQQFEENSMLNLKNQDSSDRNRSGSYSEGGPVRRRMVSGSAITRSRQRPPVDEKMSQFHKELTETCTDVMARYTFGNLSAVPHRSPLVQFLLAGGQKQTWMVGNKIISITTSGSGNKVGNTGLCEKCLSLYHNSNERKSANSKKERRRHKSAACLSRSHSQVDPVKHVNQEEGNTSQKWSRDDLSLSHDDTTLSQDDVFNQGSRDDVAVQTGSSLSGSWTTTESLESLFFGLKIQNQEKRVFGTNQCNCWCNSWCEIHIRGPSGNLSWMMRIENEMGSFSTQHDTTLPDITLLFAPMKEKWPGDSDSLGKIDSESLGEDEYESLYSQHFPSGQGSHEESPIAEAVSADEEQERLTLSHEEYTSCQDFHLQSPSTLRKSSSSPSLLGSCGDDLSPRENMSDLMIQADQSKDAHTGSGFSDHTRKLMQMSDGKNPPIMQRSSSCHESEKDLDKDSQKAKMDTDQMLPREEETSKTVKPEPQIQEPGSGLSHSQAEQILKTAEDLQEPSIGTVPINPQVVQSAAVSTPGSSEGSSLQDEVSELPPTKKRGHTISVMSPAKDVRLREDLENGAKGSGTKDTRGGVCPSMVFLQLFHSHPLLSGPDAPLLLPESETINRSLKMLDHIHPYETHKIGVIYVGPRQATDEKAILSNLYGSERYAQFIQELGQLICLKDVDQDRVYVGGLTLNGTDGQFAYSWQDESMQVIFHVATLMPNRDSDPSCNAKKLHIGNDYVTIVYNDSGEDYRIGTIKGQFNYVNIMIRPLDCDSNAVTLQTKEVPSEFKEQITTDIAEILGHTDTKIISDVNLALLVRQIAMHCNLASMVLQRQQSQPQDPFASNWLERLRQIKRIRQKVHQEETGEREVETSPESVKFRCRSFMEDFTDYV